MEEIQETLDRFLRAFSELRLHDMAACFTEDATAFFPIAHHRPRLEGREAIEEAFAIVLERIKASGATRLSFEPEDVRIKTMGDAAIATFHLRDDVLCRRTFFMRRVGDGWGIEHMHASNAPLTPPGEA